MKKKVTILSVFILIIILFKSYDLDMYFSFKNLKIQKDILSQFVQENYFLKLKIVMLNIDHDDLHQMEDTLHLRN